MSMKKTLLKGAAYLLTIAITAGVAISGTVAYLQDEDKAVNVMTTGSVYIEQNEYQRAEGVAHNAGEEGKGNGVKEGALVEFKQGQPIYPAVPADNTAYTAEATDLFYWGDYVYSGTAGNGLWNDDKLANVMDKMIFVENTGKSDAYFRTIIAFECPEGMEFSEGSDKEFMMNVNGSTTAYTWEHVGYVTIDGVRYWVEVATYQKALAPGNQSHPSLLQVVMTHNADNEDMEKLGASYEILALSQAVQVEGFADAATALNTAFGEITTTNHPWSNTVFIRGNDGNELKDALANGKEVVLSTDITEIDDAAFDGNDATITLAGAGSSASDDDKQYAYLAFAPGKGNNTKVENLTVTGSGFVEVGHYGEGGGTYEINKLVVEDMTATLCINNGGNNIAAAFSHYGKATMTDCVMTGTVAVKPGYTAYDAAFVNGTKTAISGGEYGKIYLANQAHVTITGAKVGAIDNCAIAYKNLGNLTIDNGTKVGTITLKPATGYKTALTVKAGAEVDTIIYDGSSKPDLTIEDGAVVDEIIFNGVSYDLNAWKAL